MGNIILNEGIRNSYNQFASRPLRVQSNTLATCPGIQNSTQYTTRKERSLQWSVLRSFKPINRIQSIQHVSYSYLVHCNTIACNIVDYQNKI